MIIYHLKRIDGDRHSHVRLGFVMAQKRNLHRIWEWLARYSWLQRTKIVIPKRFWKVGVPLPERDQHKHTSTSRNFIVVVVFNYIFNYVFILTICHIFPFCQQLLGFQLKNFFRATRRNWSVARTQDTVVWSPTTVRCPPGFVGKHCLSPMETYISFSFRVINAIIEALTTILLGLTTLMFHDFGFQSLFWSWLLIYS